MEIELGAFVLHTLDSEEADAVQLHLGDCEACRDEVDRLAFTASLLALLAPRDIERLEELETVDNHLATGDAEP